MEDFVLNENEPKFSLFMRRLVAYLLDTAILWIVFMGFRLAVDELLPSMVINLILNVVTLLYFSLMESSSRQATIGKGLLGLVVTDKEGNRISFKRAFLRNIARYVNLVLFGLGYITIFFTKRRQGVHDLIGGTCVTRLKTLQEYFSDEDEEDEEEDTTED